MRNDQQRHPPHTDRKRTLKSVLLNFIDRKQPNRISYSEKLFLPQPSAHHNNIGESLNKRKCQRRLCHVEVQIFDCDTHDFFSATALNYCHFGMYLESDYAPRIGSGIALKMNKQAGGNIGIEEIPNYHFCVIWRKELSSNVHKALYGIGVRPCRDLEEFLELFSHHSGPKIY